MHRSRKRQAIIDRHRPSDPDAAAQYDHNQSMYDEVGEEYPGQRFGSDGWGPMTEEEEEFYGGDEEE